MASMSPRSEHQLPSDNSAKTRRLPGWTNHLPLTVLVEECRTLGHRL